MAHFETTIHQNELVPPDGTDVHAIVAVTCTGAGAAGDGAETGEVLVVDVSWSMSGGKLAAAREALAVALDRIGDGVWFAVIAGASGAKRVYPPAVAGRPMARMDAASRRKARAAVNRLEADGGTAIGSWLHLATDTVERSPVHQAHALLLTDGQDGDGPGVLSAAVERATGLFQCDCRGVGAGWDVATLRRIAEPLLGTVDLIAEPAGMAADFDEVLRKAMARGVPDARLRLWTPTDGRPLLVRQVTPTLEDLTDRRQPVDEQTGDYPTGAWADETREYHVAVRVPAKPLGADQLVGRLAMAVDGETVGPGRIRALWSGDERLTTRVEPRVERWTRRAEMAGAIRAGVAAHLVGDDATATVELGRALRLAHEMDDGEMTDRIARVAHIDDAATGTIRLRPAARRLDLIELDTQSVKTGRI